MMYDIYLKNYVGGYDFDANYVEYVLNQNPDREVNVLINSLGGSLSAALTISSAFRRHGNVHVHYTGMNASAATIASLGAKTVTMDAHAFYLIHKCSIPIDEFASLNADEFRQKISEYAKTVADLDKLDLSIADMYATRCKKPVADLIKQMEQGGWLTADEALEFGFVDSLTNDVQDQEPLTASLVASLQQAGLKLPEALQATDLQNVCRIIGVSALEFCEDVTAITRQELQTIEDAIIGYQNTIHEQQTAIREQQTEHQAVIDQVAAQTETIARLEAERTNLQNRLDNQPADEPEQVIAQRNEPTTFSEQFEALQAARQLFNKLS